MSDTRRIDLHSHSTVSDGTFSPTELVHHAVKKGVSVVALTDHDTVAGIPEFLKAAEEYPDFTPVAGVEISINFSNKEVHIVGLFVDYTNEPLLELLREIRDNRNERNARMITRLVDLGYDISLDEVLAEAGGESVGRPHFANVLIRKGYFEERQQAFDACLKRGTKGYCSRVLPTLERALSIIHGAGGLTIWAHPVYRSKNERSYVRKSVRYMKKYGLDGLESYYSIYSEWQHQMLLEVTKEFDLLNSGGSDFHGSIMPNIELGHGEGTLHVPYSIYQTLYDTWLDRKEQLWGQLS